MERRLDSWEESLRRSVTRHEATPPANGWEDIERRLAASGLAAPRPARRRAVWLKAAAAGLAVSAAAAVALVALLAPPASVEDGGLAPVVSRQVAEAAKGAGVDRQCVSAPAESASVSRKLASALSSLSSAAAGSARVSSSLSVGSSSPVSADITLAETQTAPVEYQDGDGDAAGVNRHAVDTPAVPDAGKGREISPSEKSKSARRAAFPAVAFAADRAGRTSARRHAPQFSLAMNAVSPTGSQRQDGFNVAMLRSAQSEEEDGGAFGVAGLLSAVLERNVRTEVDYGMPVQIGLGVGIPLTSRWRVNTGLVYTRLSADIRSGSDDVYNVTKQRVYYVGVPVQAGYTFFTSRVADLYVTAGATAEKAVKVRCDKVFHRADGTVALDEDGVQPSARGLWQFSANLSAGVQLNVAKWVGVYCEPGVAYYFNDRSSLPSVRHEHPCNFNLQAGLRFSLP